MSERARSISAAILLALALTACGETRTQTTTGGQVAEPTASPSAEPDDGGTAGWSPQSADAAEAWAQALAHAESCRAAPISARAAENCVANGR